LERRSPNSEYRQETAGKLEALFLPLRGMENPRRVLRLTTNLLKCRKKR
jgi:hypothetical protein